MYKNKKDASIPISEAVKNDPKVASLVESISSGRLTAMSPCGSMVTKTTEEEKDFIRNSLRRVFIK